MTTKTSMTIFLNKRSISQSVVSAAEELGVLTNVCDESFCFCYRGLDGSYSRLSQRFFNPKSGSPKEKLDKTGKIVKTIMLYGELPQWEMIHTVIVVEGGMDWLAAYDLFGEEEGVRIVGIRSIYELPRVLAEVQPHCDHIYLLLDIGNEVDGLIADVIFGFKQDVGVNRLGGIYDARHILTRFDDVKDINDILMQGHRITLKEVKQHSIHLASEVIDGNINLAYQAYCEKRESKGKTTYIPSDMQIAKYLCYLYGIYRLDSGALSYYDYHQQRWLFVDDSDLGRIVTIFCNNHIRISRPSKMSPLINNVVAIIPRMVGESKKIGSQNIFLVPLQDTAYDPYRKVSLPYKRDMLVYRKFPYKSDDIFNNPGSGDQFHSFLDSVFCEMDDTDKQRVIAFLQEWFGTCLTPTSFDRLQVIFHGDGANGKGAFAKIIQGVISTGVTSSVGMKKLQSTETMRPQLVGSYLNVDFDLDNSVDLNHGDLKALVAHEPVECRKLYHDSTSISFDANHLLLTNNTPKHMDKAAVRDRYVIVPFQHMFAGSEKKTRIEVDIIDEEKRYIFRWMLQGLERLLERSGSRSPSFDYAEVEHIRSLTDERNTDERMLLLTDFARGKCRISSDIKGADKELLFSEFNQYAHDKGLVGYNENQMKDFFGKNITKINPLIKLGRGSGGARSFIDGIEYVEPIVTGDT